MTVRHCLDCGALVMNDSRCPPHRKARDRAFAAKGRARRGSNWAKASKHLRRYWASIGAGCIESGPDCKGAIQADHVTPGVFAPRCAYHNNKKH